MWELCWSVAMFTAVKERDGQLFQYDIVDVQEVGGEC